jgi:hypothetical protein
MSYTPGEKAILAQVRHLVSTSGSREQQVKTLVTQWPAGHVETYSKAFQQLVASGLIQHTGGQTFSVTDAGLSAIGARLPEPRPAPKIEPVARPAPRPAPQPVKKPSRLDALRRVLGLGSRAG